MDPTGAPADDVEIFRSFIRHRVAEDGCELDLTLDPQMFRRILKLAELGLEHPEKSRRACAEGGTGSRLRAARAGIGRARYGVSGARARRLIRAMCHRSRLARYRSDAALAKHLQRIEERSGRLCKDKIALNLSCDKARYSGLACVPFNDGDTLCTASSLTAITRPTTPELAVIATRGTLSQWRHRGYGPRYTFDSETACCTWART